MIGKSNWFSRRKYTGWGFTPKTWQGWLYIVVMILPFILITNFQIYGPIQILFMIIWVGVFIFDFIDIGIHMERDERERIHEALAERNALWAIVTVLGAGIAYQASSSIVTNGIVKIDPIIIITLVVGLIVKIISNVYLDKKN
jgi:hypothetical protein